MNASEFSGSIAMKLESRHKLGRGRRGAALPYRQQGGAQLMLFIAIVVALGAVSFALQNSVPVTVTFMVWRFDSSLAMVLLLAVALGALAVALLAWPTVLRERWALARERKRVAGLEAALRDARQAAGQSPTVGSVSDESSAAAPRR